MSGGGRYPHLISAILATPWAIDPYSIEWAAILEILDLRSAGARLTESEITARLEAAAAERGPRRGGGGSDGGAVAIVPVYGVISPRLALMSRMSGGTAADETGDMIARAVADPDVAGVVLDIDSPGGNVQGITELFSVVRDAAKQKPIAAVANHTMASAAYWGFAAATEIVATPSAQLGSIGIIAAHRDETEADAQKGIRTTYITAGKYKAAGMGALDDETQAWMGGRVQDIYGAMVGNIAAGRGIPVATVRGESWGEGRTLFAQKAVEVGMADRIDTLANTVRRMARGDIGRKTAPAGQAGGIAGLEQVNGAADAGFIAWGSDSSDAPEAGGTQTSQPHESPRVAPARRADLRLRLARGGYPELPGMGSQS